MKTSKKLPNIIVGRFQSDRQPLKDGVKGESRDGDEIADRDRAQLRLESATPGRDRFALLLVRWMVVRKHLVHGLREFLIDEKWLN